MAKKKSVLAAASSAFDPELNALFSSSSGPVLAPPKSRYSALLETKVREAPKSSAQKSKDIDDDEVLSEASQELEDDDEDDSSSDSGSGLDSDSDSDEDSDVSDSEGSKISETKEIEDETPVLSEETQKRERKRKRKDDNEDLEAKYFAGLPQDDNEDTPHGKRQRAENEEAGDSAEDDKEEEDIPMHESLASTAGSSDAERAACTVFLANVSTEAISSKTARKTLISHLSSALDPHDMPIQKFESIRFRSVAFSTGSMPKRAAYITKSLMGSTTKSANAYAVFSSPAAVRLVTMKLNGSEVLGRHIRVDSVAHPSPTDHRRCVFVGNLGFVDDEVIVKKDENGESVEKKRNKVPSDIEEGLWRTFGKKGKVENVRVVRDPKTRVGKGFAYVQFYDENDVEAALLLNDKAFPPMLPRKMRVTRAKDPRKTALAQERSIAKADAADAKPRSGGKYVPKMTPEQQAAAGRASRLYGKNSAAARSKGGAIGGTGQKIVFEGARASIRDNLPKDLKARKGKGKKGKGKPQNHGAKRAADWKKKKA